MITLRKERGVIIINSKTAPTEHEWKVLQTVFTEGDKYLTAENFDVPLHLYSLTLGLAKRNQDFLDKSRLIKFNDDGNKKLEHFLKTPTEELV